MAVSHRGAISFGLVHIPVGLYTATQDVDISLTSFVRRMAAESDTKRSAPYVARKSKAAIL